MTLGFLALALSFGGVAWFLFEKRRRRTGPVPPGYQTDLEFPHETEWELYHNAFSLCSMKTRLCLAELQIPYTSHHINLIETGAYETLRPKLLTVNPCGTVPVLLHEGHPIYESHEQIRYAAKFAPEGVPSLVPEDPAERDEMEAWIDRSSLTNPLEEPDKSAGNAVPGQTLPLFCTMVEKIPLHLILEGLLFHFDKRRPLMFILFKLLGIHRMDKLGPLAAAIGQTRGILLGFLDELDQRLEKNGGPWIMGEQYTLADVGWLVILERIRQASCENVFLDPVDRPHVAAYWQRLQDRPAYQEAILDHYHPLIEHGRVRIAEAKEKDTRVRVLLEGASKIDEI
jgi:glutathione S-transferase|tara:strand:- start:1665 stop:2690 length:1026 start_codon:yes stop_codon:yes gene_type:complete